jgi:hypothetical protein
MVKAPADLRSLARAHTEMALNVLYGVARSAKCPPSARVQAAAHLLDRGWGKAEQAHVGPDGGDIRVTIRHVEESGKSSDVNCLNEKPDKDEGDSD